MKYAIVKDKFLKSRRIVAVENVNPNRHKVLAESKNKKEAQKKLTELISKPI